MFGLNDKTFMIFGSDSRKSLISPDDFFWMKFLFSTVIPLFSLDSNYLSKMV